MSIHSPFAPSSMDKIVHCAGYVNMMEQVTAEETEEEREGTAAHWVGSNMLMHQPVDVGMTAPNGVIITDEMFDAALTYYNDVHSIADGREGIVIHVEEPVVMPQVDEICFGTPDCWLYIEETHTLHVWDFKYGHKIVKANNNWQLLCYDVGILNQLFGVNNALQDMDIYIVNHVIQPRCYTGDGSDNFSLLPAVELRSHVNIMNTACVMAKGEHPQCSTGSHCYGCNARHVCEALLVSSASIIDYSSSSMAVPLSENALAYELRLTETAIERLNQRKDALERDAYNRLHVGKVVGAYYLEQGYSNNEWVIPVDQVIAMGNLFGVSLKKDAVKTPFQTKKLLAKNKIDESAIEGMYGRKPTTMKLRFDDGSRAEKIFSQHKL